MIAEGLLGAVKGFTEVGSGMLLQGMKDDKEAAAKREEATGRFMQSALLQRLAGEQSLSNAKDLAGHNQELTNKNVTDKFTAGTNRRIITQEEANKQAEIEKNAGLITQRLDKEKAVIKKDYIDTPIDPKMDSLDENYTPTLNANYKERADKLAEIDNALNEEDKGLLAQAKANKLHSTATDAREAKLEQQAQKLSGELQIKEETLKLRDEWNKRNNDTKTQNAIIALLGRLASHKEGKDNTGKELSNFNGNLWRLYDVNEPTRKAITNDDKTTFAKTQKLLFDAQVQGVPMVQLKDEQTGEYTVMPTSTLAGLKKAFAKEGRYFEVVPSDQGIYTIKAQKTAANPDGENNIKNRIMQLSGGKIPFSKINPRMLVPKKSADLLDILQTKSDFADSQE